MTVMPYGGFMGKSLDAIPHPYLRWAVNNVDFVEVSGLQKEIKAIIRNSPGRSSNSPRQAGRGCLIPSAGSQYPRLAPVPHQGTPPGALGQPSGTSSVESADPTTAQGDRVASR